MTDQIEQLLRDRLPRAVSTLSADDDFCDRAITRAITRSSDARRRRRRTWWRSSAAAVAVAAVAVGTVLVAHDREAPGSHQPPVTDTRGNRSPLSWSRDLPEGERPALAYVLDGALHQADTTVPAPGDQTELLGRTGDGWLVFREDNDAQGLPTHTAYGVLTASGAFEKLPGDPYRGSVQVQALSPDGLTFASGGSLIDLRTHKIGRTPPRARFASEWSTAGLLYQDARGHMWLWDEGADPVPVDIGSIARGAPVGITYLEGTCRAVSRIRAGGTLDRLYEGCGEVAPVSVSPDGRSCGARSRA
jgi:hypothetical protein